MIITQDWNPPTVTINALERRFISEAQRETVLIQFRKENHNKDLPNPVEIFVKMFNKMVGHDTPGYKKSQNDIDEEKKREKALENKTEKPKDVSRETLTQAQAREHMRNRK